MGRHSHRSTSRGAARYLAFVAVDPAGTDRRRLGTMRLVLRFVSQLLGVLVILLVLFGPPSQLSTVLALAAAGLTVALKDFIVAFFGWFVLMGPSRNSSRRLG